MLIGSGCHAAELSDNLNLGKSHFLESLVSFPSRPIAFVLVSSNHGSMIVNRNDYCVVNQSEAYGVGFDIMNQSSFSENEVQFLLALLDRRRSFFGEGVIAIDGGANIGVHTVEWARHMHDWGYVLAYEAQEAIYYALAGNLALNNCLNVRARLAALGSSCGDISVPRPNYNVPASFGSLELRKSSTNEFIGQQISYEANACASVPMLNVDSLGLRRLDLIKIDVEGMEVEVLRGARETLARTHPIIFAEIIKTDRAELVAELIGHDYQIFQMGMNMLGVHQADPTLTLIHESEGVISLDPVTDTN